MSNELKKRTLDDTHRIEGNNHEKCENPILVQQQQQQQRNIKRKTTPRTNESLYQLVKPSYFFEGHLRKVYPYFFEHQIYAKKRWLGRSLESVFRDEFQDRPAEYYGAAIAQGCITINGDVCSLDQLICNSDLISHLLHRHEPPVSSQPVDILFNNGELLVVNKPASMPVHPSGRYRFNTLVEILKHDLQLTVPLGVVNRLDRLTSGICMLSMGASRSSRQVHTDMADKLFTKEYIAKVSGRFPAGRVVCTAPLRLLEHKLGVVVVDEEEGKEASTSFELMRVIGQGQEQEQEHGGVHVESLVRCMPSTGRTHQIRVHLLHLGFPISNDPLYGHPCWREEGVSREKVLEALMQAQLAGEEGELTGGVVAGAAGANDDATLSSGAARVTTDCRSGTTAAAAATSSTINTSATKSRSGEEKPCGPDSAPPSLCLDCARATPRPDPSPEQLCLFLHAHKYSCAKWSHTAPPPAWALVE